MSVQNRYNYLFIFLLFFGVQNLGYGYQIDLQNGYEFFEDNSGKETIESIQTKTFEKVESSKINFGLSNSVFWIRFYHKTPQIALDEYKMELDNTLIEDLQLYTFIGDSTEYSVQKAGRVYPFSERKYPFKSFLFDIPQDEKEHCYYLRVKSLYTIAFPIEFAPFSKFSVLEIDKQLLFGFIFGLIFLVGIYNLLMYFFVKEKVYIAHTIYAFIFGYYNVIFVGLDVQYIYPDAVFWPKISASVFAALSLIIGCQLSRMFLSTKSKVKIIDNILLTFIGMAIILAIIPFFSMTIFYKKVITLFPIIIFIPTIWAGVIRIKHGFEPAKLFVVGWFFLGLGIVCYGLRSTQLLEDNLFTANAIPLGTVFEMFFLSASLSYKFKLLKDENDLSKEQRIKHLEEVRHLKDKANKELEEKVQLRTIEVLRQKDELASKNKHITDSINYAKKLQESLLPSQEMIKETFLDSFVLYQPKDIVSGDFYWFYKGGKCNYFIVADCTGHGVPGALMSILGHSYLDEIVRENENIETGDLLGLLHQKVNYALTQNIISHRLNDGMDVAVLRFDKTTNAIHFSGAKRPVWVINEGKVEVVRGSKYPIGGSQYGDQYGYETVELNVKNGDSLYLFTDGYPDQFGGEEDDKIKTKVFREMLKHNVVLPMDQQREELSKFFINWKRQTTQTDDVLVVGIKL